MTSAAILAFFCTRPDAWDPVCSGSDLVVLVMLAGLLAGAASMAAARAMPLAGAEGRGRRILAVGAIAVCTFVVAVPIVDTIAKWLVL